MKPLVRRWGYVLICTVVLMLWIWYGHFDAIEAPYVRF